MPIDLFNNIFKVTDLSQRVEGDKEYLNGRKKKYRREYPLHVAAKFNLIVFIKYLVNFCFWDVNITDDEDKTPLHVAMMNGCVEAVKLLFPLTNVTLDNNTTWLHLAVMSNNVEIVEYIISETEVNVNLQDNEGRSPLHIAVENNHDVIIEKLLRRNNDLYLKNKKGKTVFDLVKSELAELLLIGEEVIQQCGKSMRDIMEKVTRSGLCLGEGGFGKAYRIDSLPSGKKAVVKKAIDDADSNTTTKKEIEMLYKVRHKNCVRLFYGCFHDNVIHVFMEFVQGSTLRDLISNKSMTPKLIIWITKQLVECLCYLKSISMTHRDIKPENIIIRSRDSCVKLIDFGLAKIADLYSHRQSVVGTPDYMAPEIDVKNTTAIYSYKVDVWSLGVVFTEMWLKVRVGTFNTSGLGIQGKIDKWYEKLCNADGVNNRVKEFFKATVVKEPDTRSNPEDLPELFSITKSTICNHDLMSVGQLILMSRVAVISHKFHL